MNNKPSVEEAFQQWIRNESLAGRENDLSFAGYWRYSNLWDLARRAFLSGYEAKRRESVE